MRLITFPLGPLGRESSPLGPESLPGRLAWPNPFGIRRS